MSLLEIFGEALNVRVEPASAARALIFVLDFGGVY